MIKTITKDARDVAHAFGFRNEKEFVARAIDEKVKRLKAMLFSRTAEKVRKGLASAGRTERDILADFERFRK